LALDGGMWSVWHPVRFIFGEKETIAD
jgi:hypothetical protein